MKTRHYVLLLAAILVVPNVSQASEPVDCGNDQGREHLSLGSHSWEFDAPAVAAPELAAAYAETGPLVTRHRTAQFQFLLDLAPYQSADMKARLDWTDLSDYDLVVHDGDGLVRASSINSNIDDGQTTFEELEAPVTHCERITVSVRNWAGIPSQPLTLKVELTGTGDMLACAANDPAPGCAGKSEGEAPDASVDTRPRYFLGGDPGQISMADAYVYGRTQERVPFNGTMTSERPTGGVPNQHTRPVFGYRAPSEPTGFRNPLVAHYELALDQPLELSGAPSAMIWVSSASADSTSVIFADLYADGLHIGSASITGSQLSNLRDPTALYFAFGDIDETVSSSLTLQIGMNPAATSVPSAGNPADALLTLWYGSAQFQSRLTLPS